MFRSTFLILGLCVSTIHAASPSLGSITPRGVQRGIESVINLNGGNLADAQEVIFYQPGFTVTKLEVVNPALVKATVKVAPDARLGEYGVRVRTATGVTEMRTLWVGALPIVDEKEPNNDLASAQKIPLNTTVHGIANNEDDDFYAVEVKKGQRISVEIEGMRLATSFFDPYIAILNSKRFELASSDDTPLLKQDGHLSIIAPEDGTYYVQVRETSYAGNGACYYRVHIGSFPRPTAIIPAGGKLGEEIEVRFLGDPSGEIRQKIKLPTQIPEGGRFEIFCQDAQGISPSGMPFRLIDLPNFFEAEPNDDLSKLTSIGAAPLAFHGIIEKEGDLDFFRFTAKKGQVLDINCFARRLGSRLDSVMFIGVVGGGIIASNDDSAGPDSYFRVSIPNDGEYWIQVTDHLKKGGIDYFYRIEINPVIAQTNATIPQYQQFTQARQAVSVPKGNRIAKLISVERRDWGGDLTSLVEGLPAKVTAFREPVPSNLSVIPYVFEAAADAPLGTGLLKFTAKPADEKIVTNPNFYQTAELVYGPNNVVFAQRRESRAVLTVSEAVPFKISIVEPKVPLVQNGAMNLKIVAERTGDFKGPITIVPLYNPPGIGAAGSVTIPEGQNEVLLPMNAAGNAPPRKWKYVVQGFATVGNGPVWVSSQLATIEVAPPYMSLAIERGAVEQGKETQMFVKLTNTKPFTGNAKIRLINLPPKTTTVELDITKDTKEIAFPIKVEPTAPAGTHRNLFCQVIVPENGETILHNLGSSELRIDVPLPPKKDAPVVATPMPTPMPMPNPMGMPPKRLTRLEQLRLEQEEREKALKMGMGTTPPPAEPKKN